MIGERGGRCNPISAAVSAKKTKNGVELLLIAEAEASGIVARGGPTEFVTARSNVNVTLRAGANGSWQCLRAISQQTDLTVRNGPLMSGRGPERDLTAEVQEWLDAKKAAGK
jgi:hypothetical protein